VNEIAGMLRARRTGETAAAEPATDWAP